MEVKFKKTMAIVKQHRTHGKFLYSVLVFK